MKKEIEIRFDRDIEKEYDLLKKTVEEEKKERKKRTFNMKLLDSIDRALDNIKRDLHYGRHVQKEYLTKEAIQKYGTDKVWIVNLFDYWRLIYTLVGNDVKIIGLILDYIDHNQYNKLFKNFKKK